MASAITMSDAVEVDTVLEQRQTLGADRVDRVRGQISVGLSEVVRLRPDSPEVDDVLARRLVRDEDSFTYFLVRVHCTLRVGDAPIVEATVSLQLRQHDMRRLPAPEVWSMDPLRRCTTMTTKRAVNVTGTVKIEPVEVGGSTENETSLVHETPYLVAEGVGEPQAEWQFVARPGIQLAGSYSLDLVVRSPARRACWVDLAVSAKRRERFGGIIAYRAAIPPTVQTITLRAQ